MNLQRREEIRELIAQFEQAKCSGISTAAEDRARDAMRELLAHIDALEQTAAERVIADGSRGPTSDYTGEGSARVPPKCEPIPTSGQREKDIWNDGFAHGWRAGFDDDGRQMMNTPAVVVPEDIVAVPHDGLLLIESSKARQERHNVVGAYFDRLGNLQEIREGSLYDHQLQHLPRLLCAIPSDRVLGEGMVAVDRHTIEKFTAGCHEPMPGLGRCGDQYPGGEKQLCSKCMPLRDALCANQGGAAT